LENGRVAESGKIWTNRTFQHRSWSWQNFTMTSPATSNPENAINEHSFPLIIHTAYFDTRFGRYGLLKSGNGVELILDRLL
jgi:hypothetical protein